MIKEIPIENIVIPEFMIKSTPSESKIQLRKEYYEKHGEFPVIDVVQNVDNQYVLKDGYIVYLLIKEMGGKTITCNIFNKETIAGPNLNFGKRLIFDKYEGRCYICGRPVHLTLDNADPMQMTLDHIVPQAKGGSSQVSNLAACCKICNGLKGDFTYSPELKHVIRKDLEERGLLPPKKKKRSRSNTKPIVKGINNHDKIKKKTGNM